MKKKDNAEHSVYEKQLKKYKQRVAAVIAIVVIIVLAIAFYFINQYMVDNFNSYKVIHRFNKDEGNSVQYESYNNKLLKYSRDGVSAISSNGKILWNASYDINNPKVVTCGSYIAIADIGGKQAYVFDSKGTTYPVETTQSIIDVNVGNQGVIGLTVEGEDYNQIQLYNAITNTKLVEKQTVVQNDGYPVDMALSNDAKKMVSSYVRIENGVLESNVGFSNFTGVGDNYIDKLVGGEKFNQLVAHDVKFLGNDTVLICTDKGFSMYEMEEIPSKLTSKTFDQEIQSMFYTNEYVGYIVKSEKENSKGKMLLYNRKGKAILTKEIKFNYENVAMYGQDIIFTTETDIYIVETNGRIKFKYKSNNPFVNLLPSSGKNEYMLITDHEIQLIKLVEEKKR